MMFELSEELELDDRHSDVEVGAGNTTPGETNWQYYNSIDGTHRGIFLDVDTRSGNYSETPLYFTSLGGVGWHWDVIGATSIYRPTRYGFRVYLQYANGSAPTPESANEKKWHINWLGLDKRISWVGSTEPGNTAWQEYRSSTGQVIGLFTDVKLDGRGCLGGYITSLGGTGWHWNLVGTNAIYNKSRDGFRVYTRYANGKVPSPELANEKKWHINWCCTDIRTIEGNTSWREYRTQDGQLAGIYLDVDYPFFSEKVPLYFTSIGGVGWHWGTTGACSIYRMSKTGFRVYIRYVNGLPPTPASANEKKWHLCWKTVLNWAPRKPTNFTLQDISENSIKILWTDNSSNELYFILERRLESNQNWTRLPVPYMNGSGIGRVLSYTDTGLTPDTTYCYRVTARNLFGDSEPITACATTKSVAEPLPDLQFGFPAYEILHGQEDDEVDDLYVYEPFVIRFTFHNTGDKTISKDFKIKAEIKHDTLDESYYTIWDKTVTENIEADAIKVREIPPCWVNFGGLYHYRITLDSDDDIHEKNEGNNKLNFTFTAVWVAKDSP